MTEKQEQPTQTSILGLAGIHLEQLLIIKKGRTIIKIHRYFKYHCRILRTKACVTKPGAYLPVHMVHMCVPEKVVHKKDI